MTLKKEAHKALTELRSRLEGCVPEGERPDVTKRRNLSLLATVERFNGELRQKISALNASVESQTTALENARAAAQESQSEQARLQEALRQASKQSPRPVARLFPCLNGSHQLVLGVDQSAPTPVEYEKRVDGLRKEVRHYLYGFPEQVALAEKQELKHIAIHQDAFAANLDVDELILLGMAIKYAGLYGVSVEFNGFNRSTHPWKREEKCASTSQSSAIHEQKVAPSEEPKRGLFSFWKKRR